MKKLLIILLVCMYVGAQAQGEMDKIKPYLLTPQEHSLLLNAEKDRKLPPALPKIFQRSDLKGDGNAINDCYLSLQKDTLFRHSAELTQKAKPLDGMWEIFPLTKVTDNAYLVKLKDQKDKLDDRASRMYIIIDDYSIYIGTFSIGESFSSFSNRFLYIGVSAKPLDWDKQKERIWIAGTNGAKWAKNDYSKTGDYSDVAHKDLQKRQKTTFDKLLAAATKECKDAILAKDNTPEALAKKAIEDEKRKAIAKDDRILENQILEDKTLSLRKLARKINVVADDGQKHTFTIYGVAVSTKINKLYTKDSFDSKFEYFLGVTPEGLYVMTYIVTGNANELTRVEQSVFDHTKIRGLAERISIANPEETLRDKGFTYLSIEAPLSKFNQVNYYRSYFGGKNRKEITKDESTGLYIDFKNPKEAQNFKKLLTKK